MLGVKFHIDPLDEFVFALVIWAWLSLAWSPDRDYSMICASRLTELMGVLFFARRIDIETWLPLVAAIACCIGLITILDQPDSNGMFGNANNAAEFFLIASPFLIGALWHNKLWAVSLAGPISSISIFVAVYLIFVSTSHLQFFVLGSAAIYGAAKANRKTAFAVTILIALFTGLFLDGHPDFVSGKWSHVTPRLQVWFASLCMWLDHPIIGVGIGAFDRWFPDYQSSDLRYFPIIHSEAWDSVYMRAGAAHQEFLHLATELGAVGLLIVLAALALAWHRTPWSAAKAAVGITILLSLIDFPMQKPETATLAMLAFASMTRKHDRLA